MVPCHIDYTPHTQVARVLAHKGYEIAEPCRGFLENSGMKQNATHQEVEEYLKNYNIPTGIFIFTKKVQL